MPEMIARCGFKCHACPAYFENNRTSSDQTETARGWKKYFNLAVPAKTIRCNGCLTKDSGGYAFPTRGCFFSECVQAKGLDNCAACSDYPCETLEERMRDCENVRERFHGKVTTGEFNRFIAPYDPRATLDGIRKK
jgi:hypothetical protein